MKRSDRSPLGYYTVGIAALFLAGFLLLVIFGARIYRDIVDDRADNMRARSVLAYVHTCVRSGDAAGGVTVAQGPEGPMLVIADGDTGYGLHIYLSEGRLLESFSAMGQTPDPADAEVICAQQTFDVTALSDGVLAVECDEGRALVSLRSGGDFLS